MVRAFSLGGGGGGGWHEAIRKEGYKVALVHPLIFHVRRFFGDFCFVCLSLWEVVRKNPRPWKTLPGKGKSYTITNAAGLKYLHVSRIITLELRCRFFEGYDGRKE